MALTDKLTAIANAIREKTGNTESLTLEQMVTEITGIEVGGGGGSGGGSGGGAIIEYGSYTPAEDTVGLKCSSGRMAETHTFPSFLIVTKRWDGDGNAVQATSVTDTFNLIWEKVFDSGGVDSSGDRTVEYKLYFVGRTKSIPMTLCGYTEFTEAFYKDPYFDGAENLYQMTDAQSMKYLAGKTYDWIAIW